MQDELTTTSQQAFQVERTMREITTLNQMISTAVMQQAESIEQLYNTAVEATINIQRGNKSLKKTLALNRSSTRVYFVLLMTASFLLLFFHWFYS
jgi:syntaxin 18